MPNDIQKDGTVSEQWRLQWGYTPFRVDRDRLIGHIFGSIARRKHLTAKIMAPYYRQLFTANPMALTPLSVDDLEGVKVKIERSVLTVAPRPIVPINKNVHHYALTKCIMTFDLE